MILNMAKRTNKKYDIVVIGGGHAGCEAALAGAKMGSSVLLITTTISKIATMPCNPAIGGPGKGHLVGEIDALGGAIGKISDASLIQIRLLNSSKGPAVQAYRAQIEREDYKKLMINTLKKQKNLELLEDEATEVKKQPAFGGYRSSRHIGTARKVKSKKEVFEIITKKNRKIESQTVIVTPGTFLNGKIIIGDKVIREGGRIDEDSSKKLSENLKKLGLKLERLQTATPPRIAKNSVDFSKMDIQPGTPGPCSFSFPKKEAIEYGKQIPCWLTYTNKKTHEVIRKNLKYSPIKSGIISEHGPRHCPSIDRKVVNFPQKPRHPVFVEPEGRNSDRLYLQGLTTAMPEKFQKKIIRTVKGLGKAEILQPGYAVVYDFVPPWQIKNTLETKKVPGLFLAGQINGTSGYEEAAAQGIMAGINAALSARGRSAFGGKNKNSFVLKRDEAYIAVLIDDLITKKYEEPYRIYTSAAEYRLLLRQSNADLRLTDYGYKLGLIDKRREKEVEKKLKRVQEISQRLKKTHINGKTAWNFLKRPEIKIEDLLELLKKKKVKINASLEILEEIEVSAKYEDYIKRQKEQVKKHQELENEKIPKIDYDKIPSLRFAAKERLKEVEPVSIGQAGRIAGVNPADITALLIFLEKEKRTKKNLEF